MNSFVRYNLNCYLYKNIFSPKVEHSNRATGVGDGRGGERKLLTLSPSRTEKLWLRDRNTQSRLQSVTGIKKYFINDVVKEFLVRYITVRDIKAPYGVLQLRENETPHDVEKYVSLELAKHPGTKGKKPLWTVSPPPACIPVTRNIIRFTGNRTRIETEMKVWITVREGKSRAGKLNIGAGMWPAVAGDLTRQGQCGHSRKTVIKWKTRIIFQFPARYWITPICILYYKIILRDRDRIQFYCVHRWLVRFMRWQSRAIPGHRLEKETNRGDIYMPETLHCTIRHCSIKKKKVWGRASGEKRHWRTPPVLSIYSIGPPGCAV